MHRRLVALAALLTLLAGLLAPSPAATQEAPAADGDVRPMVFVHGFMGSGQQFETQALRFASNGYPDELIHVFEHDSLAWPDSRDQVWARLDTLVDDLRATSGHDQVVLLGHSQGTGVVQGYLNSDPARAARVAAYVNLDGATADALPGGVRTLAVWGEGSPDRQVAGATNVQFADQGHTEVVNSVDTFVAIHQFLLGEPPEHAEVVREGGGTVTISGRAIRFPENLGAAGADLTVYELDAATGARVGAPVASVALPDSGEFGPLTVRSDRFHEFAITRAGEPTTHHVHLQPFVRSSRWVRILTSEPDGLANTFWESSSHAQNLVVMRNEEWWGDQGAGSDRLAINGQEVLTPASSPRQNRTIGIFVHDAGVDRRTDLDADVPPTGLPFLIGVDLVIPAGDPPPGTTSVRAVPRNGDGGGETFCVPAHSSLAHRTSVQFNNFHATLNPDGSPAPGHPDPTCAAAAPPVEPPGPPTTVPPSTRPGSPPPAPPASPRSGTPGYTG